MTNGGTQKGAKALTKHAEYRRKVSGAALVLRSLAEHRAGASLYRSHLYICLFCPTIAMAILNKYFTRGIMFADSLLCQFHSLQLIS